MEISRFHKSILAACVSLSSFALVLTGMTKGVKTGVPFQRLNGLVTVRFGDPPNRQSCSGFIFRQWVVTAAHCQGPGVLRVSMFNNIAGTQVIPNDAAHVVMVNDHPVFGIIAIHLLQPFKDRGDIVVPRARLATGPAFTGQKLTCFGRGDNVDGPNGDPDLTSDSGGNEYRSAEYTVGSPVITPFSPSFTVGFGQFGEKIERGDSGGPCFVASNNDDEFNVVGIVNNGRFRHDHPPAFDYHGAELTSIFPAVNDILRVTK